MVQMKQVTSSHIHSVGYDDVAQELHVEYKNGRRSIYSEVPPDKARSVMNSHSIGQSIHKIVKNNHDHRYAE